MTNSAREDERQLERILAMIREDVPDLALVDKRTIWWMRWIAVLIRPFSPDFESRFTTVIGRTVYLPADPKEVDPTWLAKILSHEYVHQLDQQRVGLRFFFSYAFTPFPIWRTHRAYWERRAYAVDLMLAYGDGDDARLAFVEARLRGIFAGPSYGWMWGGRPAAATYLKSISEAIREGSLQKTAPYDRILRAWKG